MVSVENGETKLTEHQVVHTQSGLRDDRSLMHGERIFAIFAAETDDVTISAEFFTNGFCATVCISIYLYVFLCSYVYICMSIYKCTLVE